MVSEEAQQMLHVATELDYLTHIIIRMYENKRLVSELEDCPQGPCLAEASCSCQSAGCLEDTSGQKMLGS